MTVHHLKTWPEFYERVADESKPFELRKHDRDYKVGDTLVLEEWDPATERYTGRATERLVTYMVVGPRFGLLDGHCIMGLRALATTPPATEAKP